LAEDRLRAPRPGILPGEAETDLLSALFRSAFILAFVVAELSPQLNQSLVIPPFVRISLLVATLFTIVVFTSYARGQYVAWQRPYSLLIDIALVSGAIYSVGEDVWTGLFQVYYLIVLQGAIWFRRTGALATAFAAAIAYALVMYVVRQPDLNISSATEILGGMPFLIIVALVGGYLVVSRDREHDEALRMRNQMLLARAVQDLMLPPSPPEVRGWDIALQLEPALEVGGDLYILEPLATGEYIFCLGDISGKSITGLIYLSLILSHTRAAAREGLPPREIARHVNARVYDTMAEETYAALFVGLLDPTSGFLTFANCGHPPPLLLSPERPKATELFGGGIVIGAQRHPEYVQQNITIKPGQVLVAYTDGFTELRSASGEEWGEEGLGEAAQEALSQGLGAERIVDHIQARAHEWAVDMGRDDATCLVLRRLAE
jgi:hypothetical protein